MTYRIPPGSPKALKAAAFGRELTKAMVARDIPVKELARAAGVGRNSITNYRDGAIFPKTVTSRLLAEALDWPKLAVLGVEGRSFTCERAGCGRIYQHESGGPRKYCSLTCQRQAEAERMATRRLRQAAQTNDPRKRSAALAQLRSAAKIADERARVLEMAVAAMCKGCEPLGLCRTPECELRPVSPLPLDTADHAIPRTSRSIRKEAALRPEAMAARLEGTARRWARPGERERQSARTSQMHANRTPEQKAAMLEKTRLSYPPERRSETSRQMHARRRIS